MTNESEASLDLRPSSRSLAEDRRSGEKFNENLHIAGIHLHMGIFINKNLVFCIFETKDTVSDAEFPEFMDGLEALGVQMIVS